MTFNIGKFLRQPTTIGGFAALAGIAAWLATLQTTGDAVAAKAAGGSALGLVLLVLNDNSADRSSIEKLVADTVSAITTKHVGPMMPVLASDISGALTAVAASLVTPVPAPAPAPVPVVAVVTPAPAPAEPAAPVVANPFVAAPQT